MTFSANGPLSDKVAHAPGTAEITLTNAGTYVVFAQVVGSTSGQFAVELNGNPIPGGSLPVSGSVSSGTVSFVAQPNDVVTLVNTSATETATLPGQTGSTEQVNASIHIQQLDEPAE